MKLTLPESAAGPVVSPGFDHTLFEEGSVWIPKIWPSIGI